MGIVLAMAQPAVVFCAACGIGVNLLKGAVLFKCPLCGLAVCAGCYELRHKRCKACAEPLLQDESRAAQERVRVSSIAHAASVSRETQSLIIAFIALVVIGAGIGYWLGEWKGAAWGAGIGLAVAISGQSKGGSY
jgi:predicted RNA-binding Zn-ribbon protein involved in translation (DUF1610 family)